MKKPPETETDRMKIHFETTLGDAGYIIAMLTKAGMTNIGYEVVTDVRTFGTNKQYSEKGSSIVMRVLADGQPHTSKEMGEVFEASGRPKNSTATFIKALMGKKLVKKAGPALWQLTEEGKQYKPDEAAETPVETPVEPKTAGSGNYPRKTFGEAGRVVIAKVMNDGKAHSTDELKELFRTQGRNIGSVSPNMDHFLKKKIVKRVDTGVYQLIDSPVAKASINALINGAGMNGHA